MDVRPSWQEDKGERGGQVHGCPRLHRKDREQSQQRGTGLGRRRPATALRLRDGGGERLWGGWGDWPRDGGGERPRGQVRWIRRRQYGPRSRTMRRSSMLTSLLLRVAAAFAAGAESAAVFSAPTAWSLLHGQQGRRAKGLNRRAGSEEADDGAVAANDREAWGD